MKGLGIVDGRIHAGKMLEKISIVDLYNKPKRYEANAGICQRPAAG